MRRSPKANRLLCGFAAYAFTASVRTAAALSRAGMLTINTNGRALPEVPFGGSKDSDYGTAALMSSMPVSKPA